MRSLLFFLALATSSPAQISNPTPAPVEIVNLEQHLWTTMAEGDFATVRSLFAKDFIEVDERIQAVDALLINLKHCKLESYELRDLQVRILSPDSALTVYHVVNTFACGNPRDFFQFGNVTHRRAAALEETDFISRQPHPFA